MEPRSTTRTRVRLIAEPGLITICYMLLGRVSHRHDRHRQCDGRNRDQHDRVDVIGSSRPGIANTEPRPARPILALRPKELGFRGAQQRDRQNRAPSGTEEISRPPGRSELGKVTGSTS
jgi:hypothetical protein